MDNPGLEGFVEEPATTHALEVLDLRLDEQSARSLDPRTSWSRISP